jgi:large subunit ribosomal protein L9
MKVLFVKSVKGIGKEGDVKDVAPGYAQGFLFPQKIAVEATSSAIKQAEKRALARAGEREVSEALLEQAVRDLAGKVLTLHHRANEEGTLYDKVDIHDVQKGIKAEFGVDLPEDIIKLSGHFDTLGTFDIPLKYGSVSATLSLTVEPVS